MARLGLKLLHLRTRVRRVSQQQLAEDLRVRQATLSHVERGHTLPALPLLLRFCEYFDVTPTWLLDDERGLEIGPADRWSLRQGLVTTGMSVECTPEDVDELPGGRLLLRLGEGMAYYDDEAAALRRESQDSAAAEQALRDLARERGRSERALLEELEEELETHPRRRRKRE